MKKFLKNKKFGLVLLGFVLIIILFIKFGIKDLITIFLKTNIKTLLLALPFNLLVLLTRGYKWYLYLSISPKDFIHRNITRLKAISFYLINNMVSSITPFRSGELYGPFLFNKNKDVPLGHGFFIIFTDRILELVFLLFMFCVSIFILISRGLFDKNIKNTMVIVLITLLLFTVLLLFVLIFKKITISIFDILLTHIKKEKYLKIVGKILDEILMFYKVGKNYSISFYCKQALLTVTGWVFLYIANYLIILSVAEIDLLDSIISQTISIGIGLISMIPSGIGSTTVSYVYVMSLMNYDSTNLVAGSLMSKFIFLLFTFICGYISVFLNKKDDWTLSDT